MRTYKRTRITIETEQVLTIQRSSSKRRWCPQCSREVVMVRFAEAATLAGVPVAVLRECARTEPWHLSEAPDGTPLICLDSLLKARVNKTQIEQENEKDH
jgi:hypothetical protein